MNTLGYLVVIGLAGVVLTLGAEWLDRRAARRHRKLQARINDCKPGCFMMNSKQSWEDCE